MKKHIALIFITIIGFGAAQAQSSKSQVIGFYNLENLFDTINQGQKNGDEYTPAGKRAWTSERYANKLANMARVLNELGTDYQKKGAALVGVCEVENKAVLDDLVAHPTLRKKKWGVIHGDSPDKRGIDVAMLYNPKMFTPIEHRYVNPNIDRDGEVIFTRDILLVTGVLKKTDTVHVLVNHWPSRGGGEERSRPLRNQAAKANRDLVDSILTSNKNAKVIVMGDLNDDPTNESVKDVLQAQADVKNVSSNALYNPFERILANDEGSLKYRGEWNLFDQILCSKAVVDIGEYRYIKAEVYNRCYLLQQKGKYSGYPNRTFGGKKYLNGYSDHLPALIVLDKN